VKGLKRLGPPQGLGVEQVDPSVEPRDRPRDRKGATVGADGERGRRLVVAIDEEAGGERALEATISGDVPDDRGAVITRRIEGAAVWTECLAR
jgi:hypothetical protein